MTRRILSLMLLLTQATATIAGPAFTLCISPKGRVCIDAFWTTCTCCQDYGVPDPGVQPRGAVDGGERQGCESETRCSCRRASDDPSHAASAQAPPADSDPVIAHEQPCRCKHIPLVVAQDGSQPAVERTSVDDRHVLDQLLPDAAASVFGGFTPSRHAVALLPLPPPSGHLLAISCTVLRC